MVLEETDCAIDWCSLCLFAQQNFVMCMELGDCPCRLEKSQLPTIPFELWQYTKGG